MLNKNQKNTVSIAFKLAVLWRQLKILSRELKFTLANTKSVEKKLRMGFFKWLEYGLVRLTVACLRLLPVRVAYFLGEQIGWISWRVLGSRRSTVKNNLILFLFFSGHSFQNFV